METPSINPVTWFEIPVSDMQRARSFYEGVFGWKIEKMPFDAGDGTEMYALPMSMEFPGAGGALVKSPQAVPSATGTLIYFNCDDCAVELGRVESNGGKVIAPKFSIGEYGAIGIAMDTEGNTIGFHSQK